MTEAMPFLQKTILLSYDPRPYSRGYFFKLVQLVNIIRSKMIM